MQRDFVEVWKLPWHSKENIFSEHIANSGTKKNFYSTQLLLYLHEYAFNSALAEDLEIPPMNVP